ncbi:hypothetical protein GC163_08570 [bacterium]|nr:hypothetical protein [bacterium]
MHWLVSLRDPVELPAALSAGVDFIDLKDVDRGSLGMASEANIAAFTAQLKQFAPDRHCSLALGELSEWPDGRLPIAVPDNVGWVKLGLSQCCGDANWQARWLRVRRQIDQSAGRSLHWIAVAYADAEVAHSPSVGAILDAAAITDCWGLLIDTYSKSGQSLLDWLGVDRLQTLIEKAQTAGLKVALAGQVGIHDVPSLAGLQPDIVAVRSAVCVDGVRTKPLCPTRLAQFRQQLRALAEHRDPAKV